MLFSDDNNGDILKNLHNLSPSLNSHTHLLGVNAGNGLLLNGPNIIICLLNRLSVYVPSIFSPMWCDLNPKTIFHFFCMKILIKYFKSFNRSNRIKFMTGDYEENRQLGATTVNIPAHINQCPYCKINSLFSRYLS